MIKNEKYRVVETRFWIDDYVSNLDPIEKLMFLYFLTNTATNIAGVYELPLKNIAMDTGIDKEMVQKILDRFSKDGKIHYIKGWVAVVNFIDHQSHNPSVLKGVSNCLDETPVEVLDRLGTEWLQAVNKLTNRKGNRSKGNRSKGNTDYEPDFISFWELYPKKVGKPFANALWCELTELEKKAILEDVPKRMEDEKWAGTSTGQKFIKDPERYIKHRQWEDQIIKPRGNKTIRV